jgi:hypothetical protein
MTHPDCEGCRKALESAKAHLQRISEWAKNDRATWGITLDNIEVEAAIQVREIERALDAVSPPAPCEGCGKARVAMTAVLEGLRGFRACMEAQRTDTALPPGHDDTDESCGDGVCYQSGATIDRDIATLDAALSPAPAKPCACPNPALHQELAEGRPIAPAKCAPAKPCAKCGHSDPHDWNEEEWKHERPLCRASMCICDGVNDPMTENTDRPAKPCAEVTLTERDVLLDKLRAFYNLYMDSGSWSSAADGSGPRIWKITKAEDDALEAVSDEIDDIVRRLMGQGETK